MNKPILLLSTVCLLITSCNSNTSLNSNNQVQDESGPIISSGLLEQVDQDLSPGINIYPFIYSFRLANNHYPQSPQELIDYNKRITNEPGINLDDFKVLTFKHEEDESLTITWETKSEPISKGSFTMDPSDNSANSSVKMSGTVNTAQPVN